MTKAQAILDEWPEGGAVVTREQARVLMLGAIDGLDVGRLAEALRATGALWSANDYYEVTTDADEFAKAIAAEYERLSKVTA